MFLLRKGKNSRAKRSILINYHRILWINMHYKNMSQFPHLSMEGERQWQRIISYTSSILIKKPIYTKEQTLIMSLSLFKIWWFTPYLSTQISTKKALKLLRKWCLPYYFITFHCVQNKTGFFLKVLYHLKKSKKNLLIIKSFGLLYLLCLCGFFLHRFKWKIILCFVLFLSFKS